MLYSSDTQLRTLDDYTAS